MATIPAAKRAPVKVKENGTYIDIAPETYADIVYLDESRGTGNVKSELERINTAAAEAKATAEAAAVLRVSDTEPQSPAPNMIWIKP